MGNFVIVEARNKKEAEKRAKSKAHRNFNKSDVRRISVTQRLDKCDKPKRCYKYRVIF